jgi:RNA polymerase sigma-70 factor, ECF subfamily
MFTIVSNTDYQAKDSSHGDGPESVDFGQARSSALTAMSTPSDEAFAEALQRMHPALTSRARAIVGNRSDAEDAVQEAAFRAWRARGRLRAGSDPAPWLKTIVTRAALDLARERKRRTGVPIEEHAVVGPSAEESFARAEVLTTIGSAAQHLPAASRRVFMLHDLAGFSSHEIADLDNLPYHTVRTRLRRARISLRNELKEAI